MVDINTEITSMFCLICGVYIPIMLYGMWCLMKGVTI